MPTEPHASPSARLCSNLLGALEERADPDNVAGMARFGISTRATLGVTVADVRSLARDAKRELGRDKQALHELALCLWASGVHEALIMASVLDPPGFTTREQIESWVLDLDSWDTCDQLCGNLLWRTEFAWELPFAWASRSETFVKRAAFVVAAQLGGKDKGATDVRVASLLPLAENGAFDARNDVKKGVSWALRQIGKRNATCNAAAIASARRVLDAALAVSPATEESKAARWVARDVLRELEGEAVTKRLGLA